MSLSVGTLTSKGQTTIPAEVREFLGLQPGDKIRYVQRGNEIVLKPRNRRIVDFAGCLHDPERPALSADQLTEAIGDSVARHVAGDE